MSGEINSEADALSMLLGAVNGDSPEVSAPKTTQVDMDDDEEELPLDDPDQLGRTEEEPGDDGESDDGEKPAASASADDEEDYVELGDGDKTERVPLSKVLDGYREYQRFESQKREIVDRIEREAHDVSTQQLRAVEQYSRQSAAMIGAALQLLQAPKAPTPPDPSLMQSNYMEWERANARYQQEQYRYTASSEQQKQARDLGMALLKQADDAAAQVSAQRDAREARRLESVWPDFYDEGKFNSFIGDMGKEYGFSFEELDASLNDYRNALVARDALAYRKLMSDKGASTKREAEKQVSRAKVVKSRTEAKGARTRDARSGQFVSDALGKLQKSNSDRDGRAYFAALARQGRI